MSDRTLPRELMPPAPRPAPPAWVAQRRAHLVGELRPRRPRLRGPRRVLLVPIGAILVAGGAWAAGLFSGGPVHDSSNVVCYQTASLAARHTTVDIRAMAAPGHLGSPRAACVPFFERGYFSAGAASGRSRFRAAPRLVACLKGGVVRVFPGTGADLCREVGERFISDAKYRQEIELIDRAFLNANVALALAGGGRVTLAPNGEGAYISGDVCVRRAGALHAVDERLRREGLGEFRAVVDPRVRRNECLSLVVEGRHFDGRTITLSTSRIVAPHTSLADIQAALARQRRACRNPTPRTSLEIEARMDCALEENDGGGGSRRLCLTAQAARRKARRILRRAHLRDWEIRVEEAPSTPATAGVRLADSRLRLVVITFLPQSASGQCNNIPGAKAHG